MNAIKGVLAGLAATAVLFGGAAQAFATPATSQSAEASATVAGQVVAVVNGKSIKVKVNATTTVDVDYSITKTVISGELKVGSNVQVQGQQIAGKFVASGIIVIK